MKEITLHAAANSSVSCKYSHFCLFVCIYMKCPIGTHIKHSICAVVLTLNRTFQLEITHDKVPLCLKYLCVWDSVDWWKREWWAVGWKESWGERGATHAPSQGQGGATHASAQGEGGTADTPAQCKRVLDAGVDTWDAREIESGDKIFLTVPISEVVRPPRRQAHTAPERINLKVGQDICHPETSAAHTKTTI